MPPSFEALLHAPLTLFLPSLLVLAVPPAVAFAYGSLPPAGKHSLASSFAFVAPFCSLDEIYPTSPVKRTRAAGWKILVLVLGAAAMAVRWFGTAGWDLLEHQGTGWVWDGLMGALWIVAALWPAMSVMETASTPLTLFYLIQATYSILILLAALYELSLLPPVPHDPVISLSAVCVEIYSIAFSALLIGVTLSLPVSRVPDEYLADNKVEIDAGTMGASPEDRTSVYGWLTFQWVYPLIKLGSSGYLQDSDVYTLSPTQRSKPLYAAFQRMAASSLLRKIFVTNGLDLVLDASLTAVSVVLNYSSPYFIKNIIEALTTPTPDSIARAYTYALLAFLATLLKAQCDLNHLWFSRRAAVRVKSTLTSAIYEKALLRVDKSGVGESKGTAGVGTVVNLMAGDTNRISNQVSSLYMLYSSPFELVICCAFLYSLLGWSAFVGLAVVLVSMPINKGVSSRSVVIQKDLLAARDVRMNIMNELIGAIKYIKAFAWERQWSKRVIDARKVELKVVIRDRLNNVLFTLLWVVTPMLVTLVSFFCFLKIQGGELTAAVAFTALSLFSMVRMPLTVLPMFLVSLLQTKVAVQRIEDFLAEEEVPTYVSSLKLAAAEAPATTAAVEADDKIGFSGNASFRWNSAKKEVADAAPKDPAPKPKADPDAASADDAAADTAEAAPFELNDLDFIFPMGLTVVSGPTGSGKTALLYALLGEMETVRGMVHLPKYAKRFDKHGLSNSVAYSGQAAWLQNMSIKDNILFGTPFDEKRYDDVIKACCLAPDLKMLEDGDSTEIGAKGVSLSGGQKARVALARAIYSFARNVLLDDPLSAVDAHTAASLVNDCLSGPLLANRRVIIVSHHVELLVPIAHSLLRVVDGRIESQGTIDELRAQGHLSAIVATEKTAVPEDESVITETPDEAKADGDAAAPKKEARKLVKDEEREVGNVSWKTYSLYFRASNYYLWALSLVLMLISNNASILERVWIRTWTSAYPGQKQPPHEQFTTSVFAHHDHHAAVFAANGHVVPQQAFAISGFSPASNQSFAAAAYPPADTRPFFYIGIWSAILAATALVSLIQTVVGYWGAYLASVTIHDDMLHTVIRSTSRWFDTTPSGRIVNRFSRDIETIDSSLTMSLRVVANYFFALVGALVVVTAITPAFFVPAMFLTAAYYALSLKYIRCGRDLRRMESTARSPIFSGFTETLEGVVTIRAFAKEASFIDNLQSQVDKSHAAWYFTWMLNRWLLFRFDCLGGLAVFITSVLTLASGVDGGLGGIAILSSQTYTVSLYWLCRYWSQLEMDLNSVERVEEYTHLPQEAPAIVEGNRPPAYWPSTSCETLIKVEDLVIKYSPELPAVIHGISFDIKPREKIGLIGRTGSGKSTLGMSFLRFAEFAGGKIVIDGIDISKIGLEDLRSRITIIPQDAVLFSGDIRANLDPFNEHTDDEVLDALHRVQLGTGSTTPTAAPSRTASSTALAGLAPNADASSSSSAASDAPTATAGLSTKKGAIRLDSPVSSGGSNFSAGQRQLLAMARSLLRNSSIIIMDEATASVDFATDAAIQETIRQEFDTSCLITIAHRLSSVIDYDRLLVLDHGRLVEFDTPLALLQKDGADDVAIFKGMCRKSGKWDELLRSAELKQQTSAAGKKTD